LDLWCRSSWILNDSSLKIKWKSKLKILEELECAFGCCWKDLDEQDFNGVYLVRFGSRMWELLGFFNWFLPLKVQTNPQKTRFWKEKISWERGNTWANSTGHTSCWYWGLGGRGGSLLWVQWWCYSVGRHYLM
jgi:hypothetical protein